MDMISRQRLAQTIRKLMLQNGWNQAELGRRAGVGTDNISRYLNCKYIPTVQHLNRIADALGVSAPDLYDDINDEKEEYLEVKTLRRDPTQALVRIHRVLPTETALEIMALVNRAKPSGSP